MAENPSIFSSSAYKQKRRRNRIPSEQSFFCFDLVATGEQTLLLKKERKVSDTAEDVFSYTKQKAAFPQKISARKLLKALKNSHFRDII